MLNNIQEAIRAPDYIIKDKHEYTGLVVKRIENSQWDLAGCIEIMYFRR